MPVCFLLLLVSVHCIFYIQCNYFFVDERSRAESELFDLFQYFTKNITPFKLLKYDLLGYCATSERKRDSRFNRHTYSTGSLIRFNYTSERSLMVFNQDVIYFSSATNMMCYNNNLANPPIKDGSAYTNYDDESTMTAASVNVFVEDELPLSMFCNRGLFGVPFEVIKRNDKIVITDIRPLSYMGHQFEVTPSAVYKIMDLYTNEIVCLYQAQQPLVYQWVNLVVPTYYLPQNFFFTSKPLPNEPVDGYIEQTENYEALRTYSSYS